MPTQPHDYKAGKQLLSNHFFHDPIHTCCDKIFKPSLWSSPSDVKRYIRLQEMHIFKGLAITSQTCSSEKKRIEFPCLQTDKQTESHWVGVKLALSVLNEPAAQHREHSGAFELHVISIPFYLAWASQLIGTMWKHQKTCATWPGTPLPLKWNGESPGGLATVTLTDHLKLQRRDTLLSDLSHSDFPPHFLSRMMAFANYRRHSVNPWGRLDRET